MKKIAKSILIIAALSTSLTACLTQPAKPPIPLPADMDTTTFIVPASDDFENSRGFIKNIYFINKNGGRPTAQYTLRFEDRNESNFIVHSRVDNGSAGSGIKYLVNYDIKQEDDGYAVTMKPALSTEYQDGLIPFSVPSLSHDQLQENIRNAAVYMNFDVDSKYGVESIKANFKRLTRLTTLGGVITNRNKLVNFSFTATPYRNGSKVVFQVKIYAVETSKNTFDFGILKKEIKEKLTSIVKA
jgi:predicted small lipoprotein YifL